jgi:hypothetical protein
MRRTRRWSNRCEKGAQRRREAARVSDRAWCDSDDFSASSSPFSFVTVKPKTHQMLRCARKGAFEWDHPVDFAPKSLNPPEHAFSLSTMALAPGCGCSFERVVELPLDADDAIGTLRVIHRLYEILLDHLQKEGYRNFANKTRIKYGK